MLNMKARNHYVGKNGALSSTRILNIVLCSLYIHIRFVLKGDITFREWRKVV